MATAPAYSAPAPAIPDGAPPQPHSKGASPACQPGGQSSFARLLHQVHDQHDSDSGTPDKDTHEQDKNKVAQPASGTPVVVAAVPQQKVTPFTGFLGFGETAEKTGKVKGTSEQDEQPAPADQKKSQTAVEITSGVSMLMHSILGFGASQFTQTESPGKPASRHGSPVSQIPAAPIAPTPGLLAGALPIPPSEISDGAATSANDGETPSSIPQAPQSNIKAPVSNAPLALAARLNADSADTQPVTPRISMPHPQTATQPQTPAAHPQADPAGAAGQAASESASATQPSTSVSTPQAAPAEASEKTERVETQAPAAPSTSEAPAAPRAGAAQKLDQPADVRAAEIEPAPVPGANNTAVRDVRLQVTGAGDQRVDVRVMDRGGELRVSVRADDPSLVRSLQDNVAELSTRLDQAHFRSEVWTPRTQAVEQTNSANTNGRNFSNGEDTLGREARGQQQNGRQQQQPAWVDDFEENPARGKSGSFTPWQR